MELAPILASKVVDRTWLAFDTEATGYSNVAARLVEVAGVKFRFVPGSTGDVPAIEELGRFEELAHPGVPIPAEVVAIHGITDREVADAPRVTDVLARFFAFTGDAILLAHYVPFDLGAMTYALLREGKGVPRIAALDTSILPKRLFPGAPNYALPTLVKFLGLPEAASHRAMPDALSTMELFRRVIGKMGGADAITVADVTKIGGGPLTFEAFSEIPYQLPAELTFLNDAISAEADVMLEYRGGSKGGVARRVTPSHLFARDGGLFLEGYCHLDQAAKSFRVDRIERASVLPVDPEAPVFRNKGSGHWVKEPRVRPAAG